MNALTMGTYVFSCKHRNVLSPQGSYTRTAQQSDFNSVHEKRQIVLSVSVGKGRLKFLPNRKMSLNLAASLMCLFLWFQHIAQG